MTALRHVLSCLCSSLQVCITGPSGCGKTECVKTLAAAHREMGHLVKTDIVCTEAVESEELLGYADPTTRSAQFILGWMCSLLSYFPCLSHICRHVYIFLNMIGPDSSQQYITLLF